MTRKDIGKLRQYAVEKTRTHGLTPFRGILRPQLFQAACHDRLRQSAILVPEAVFWLMASVALNDTSMAAAATAFWSTLRVSLPFLPAQVVTEEAFCMARKALKLRFFKTLFRLVLNRIESRQGSEYRWKGLRLLGIDGMKLTLPSSPSLRRAYAPASNGHGSVKAPQALLVGLVGLWDGFCHGFRLVSSKGSEPACARRLIRTLRANDLLMCDRNFVGYLVLAEVLRQQAHFLFHLPSNRYLGLPRTKTASGRPDEWYVTIRMPKGLPQRHPSLPERLEVRILQYQRKGFRVSWLITSLLDTELYPYEQLVDLYHERWRQETMHREWKYTLALSNLRSKNARGIVKEVYVQLILNNVTRLIMCEAAGSTCRPVDLQFLETKRLLLAHVPVMATAPPDLLPYLYRSLLVEIRRQVIVVRPGRRYPRAHDTKPRNKGSGILVLPAKLPEPHMSHVPQ